VRARPIRVAAIFHMPWVAPPLDENLRDHPRQRPQPDFPTPKAENDVAPRGVGLGGHSSHGVKDTPAGVPSAGVQQLSHFCVNLKPDPQ